MTKKIFANEMLSNEMLDAVTGCGFIYYLPTVSDNKAGFLVVKTDTPLANKAQVVDVFLNGERKQSIDAAGGVHISIQKNNGFVATEQVQNYVAYNQAQGHQFIDFNALP